MPCYGCWNSHGLARLAHTWIYAYIMAMPCYGCWNSHGLARLAHTTPFLNSFCRCCSSWYMGWLSWPFFGGGSPVGVPHFPWATFVNPTFGPVLATCSAGLPSWLFGSGDPNPAVRGVEHPKLYHHCGSSWRCLVKSMTWLVCKVFWPCSWLVDLVGGHLTLLLVGPIALLVAHGSHLVPHGCTVGAVAVLVVSCCLGLGPAVEMY